MTKTKKTKHAKIKAVAKTKDGIVTSLADFRPSKVFLKALEAVSAMGKKGRA